MKNTTHIIFKLNDRQIILPFLGFLCFCLAMLNFNQKVGMGITEFGTAISNSVWVNEPTDLAMCGAVTESQANIQPVKNGSWQDNSVWPGGNKPTANDNVTIPLNRVITLSGDCYASTIRVEGKLVAIKGQTNNSGFNLRAKWIMVMGGSAELEIGTSDQPYISATGGTITLTGTNTSEKILDTDINSKAIMVMGGATLTIQGKEIQKTWTKINQSVNPGDNVLRFIDNVQGQWNVGDKIVIASSDFNMNEAEEVTIKSFISSNIVEIEENLQYPHFGELQQYAHGKDASINWDLDERAEVGLLSHNILIQGDMSGSSLGNGFGGHIMIMNNAKAYVSGAELYRMGQRGNKGRYPFHWHGLKNAFGQYFNRNSVHHTFNRAVTIHATSNVDVIGNVAYDNLGHAYFFEDGTETGVDMLFNLGLVTRRPANPTGFLHSDTFSERNSSGPATFWITHPENNINGNIAGGSDGSGLWFSPFNNPNGLYYDGSVNAHLLIPDGFMDNNISHSNRHGYIFGAGVIHGDTEEKANQNGWIRPPANSNPTVKDITVYKNDLGVYHRTENSDPFVSTLINFIIADNRTGDATTWKTNYDRILWVTASDNFSSDYGVGGPVGGGNNAAHIVYDGPVLTKDSHFGGITPEGYSLFDQWGANIKYTSHLFENTTTDPGAIRYNWRDGGFRNAPVWSLATVRDVDGAFSGRANSTISLDHPYLMDETSERKTNNGAQTDLKFAYVEIVPSNEGPGPRTRPAATVLRADGPQFSDNGEIQGYPVPVVVNRPDMRSRFVLKTGVPSSLRFRIFSLAPGEEIMIEVPNVPSSIQLGNVGQLANKTIEGLEASNANGVSWYWKDGTAYIKYKAGPNFVFTKSGDQANFSLCLNGGCNGNTTVPVTISSYDQRDTRGTVVKNGSNNIGVSEITHSNGRDRYTITKQGGNDACAEYVLRFGTQNWYNMSRLNILGAGLAGSEIYLYNSVTNEQRRIGMACNDTRFSFNIPNNAFYQNIAEISIKTCESQIAGASKQIEIDRIVMGNSVGAQTNLTCAGPTETDCNGTPNGTAYRDNCETCVGGNTGAIACSPNPTINFTSPSETEFEEGLDLGVVVAAQGNISNIRLYLDDVFVRQEEAFPYEWGVANPNPAIDPDLLNLAIGTYVLKAEATDITGGVTTIEKTITVSPIDTDGDGSYDFEEEEDCRSITDPSDLSFDFDGVDEGFEFNKLASSNFSPSGEWQLTANNSNDPFMYRGNLSFSGSEVSSISVRIRSERTGNIQLFWNTPGNVFAGTRVNTKIYNTANQWQEITFDVGSDPAWSGNTITGLRLDFVPDAGANVSHWIDWMRGPNGNGSLCSQSEISFLTPTETVFEDGDDLGVEVSVDQGMISNIQLYLNDALIRQDNNAPYEWGTASTNNEDPALLNLDAGTYELKAVGLDDQGASVTITKTIFVRSETSNSSPLSERLFVFDFDLPTNPLSDATQLVDGLGFKGLTFDISPQANRDKYFNYLETPEFISGALSIPVGYYGYDFNSNEEQGTNPKWKTVMNELPQNTDFWVIVKSPGATETNVNSILTEMSEEAARLGKDVVIYPHYNNHIEGVEDALPYLESLQLDNLYVTFHLCHELREMNKDRLREVYIKALPYLKYVSISGALNEIYTNPAVADWSDAILPLDENEIDLFSFVLMLEEFDHQGPVFLHTFGINNAPVNRAPADHLESSMRIWKAMTDRIQVSGIFEAEDYAELNGGVVTENTPGSLGQNLGFIENNDNAEYFVDVAEADEYSFGAYASSNGLGGSIGIYVDNDFKGLIEIPVTGEWHDYKKYSSVFNLSEGPHHIKLEFTGGNGLGLFNIDKFEVTSTSIVAVDDVSERSVIKVYPNPSENGIFHMTSSQVFKVFDVQGNLVSEGFGKEIDLSHQSKGVYILKVGSGNIKLVK